jgi:membrane protease YdiL (CAAX protease family)
MPDVVESEVAPEKHSRPEPVAPWPHTAFLLIVLALWAFYGLLRSQALQSSIPRGVTYVSHIIVECLLAGSTIAGLYHRRQFILDVIGTITPRGLVRDVGQGFLIYLSGAATMIAIWMILKPLHPTYQTATVRSMAPHTLGELGLFTLLSLATGTCEEFVFRGYLLRQFQRWWGSTALAIIASTVLFAFLHLYEGLGAVAGIGGLGAIYAIVAMRRGNLRSVMVAHFLQDALTGLILYMRH